MSKLKCATMSNSKHNLFPVSCCHKSQFKGPLPFILTYCILLMGSKEFLNSDENGFKVRTVQLLFAETYFKV